MKEFIQSLGKLFIFGFEGTSFPAEWKELSKEFGEFGIILFAHNIGDNHLAVVELYEQARSMFRCAPLFCIDQEGGRVQRISGEYFETPPALELAKTKSPRQIKNLSRTLAENLRAIGIGWNLAPVADVFHPRCSVIGNRAWHENPHVAAKYVHAWVKGQKIAAVASCLKHFPGHGRAMADTHRERSKLNVDLTELWKCEAIPFISGIRAGAESVMLAHIELKDDDFPSSLSPKVIDYLKNALKFSGLVLTDDLCMTAISKRFEIAEAAIASISAGCDMVMICKNLEYQAQALDKLARALQFSRFLNIVFPKIARAKEFWRRFSVPNPSCVLKRIY